MRKNQAGMKAIQPKKKVKKNNLKMSLKKGNLSTIYPTPCTFSPIG